ncbi:MAG: glycosyltransferase, partial [Methanobacteriaceae archaeon]|nr:glycosyltransferase [Methanobacteriaceae archaeon]
MDENMGTYDKKNILKRFNDQKQEYDLIVCEYNNIKEELIKTNQILNSKSEFINYLQTDNKKLNKELVYLIKDFKISKKNLSDKITEIQSKNLIDVENYANAINKVHRLDSDLRKLNEKNSNLKKEINKYLIKLNDKNDEIHLLKKDEKEKQDLLKENMDKINELRSFITAHNIKFSNNLKKSPKTNFTSIFPKKSINSNDNILESEKYNDNDYNLIKSSGLFDSKWYQVIYLNSEEKIDPIEHYIVIGDKKCYNPHPSFNVKEYKRLNSLSSNENALLDYIVNGVYTSNNNHDFIEDLRDSQEYRILNESILLNNSWYYSTHPDVKKLHMDPVIHYLKGGFKGQYDPNPSFSSKFYLKKHPKVKELKQNPLVDYITSYTHNYELLVDMNLNDTKENLILEESLDYLLINESKLFDKNWYKKEYNIINDPIIDYITNGYKNKDPCSEFDTNWYKIEYNLKENENPLLHYIFNGEIENKSISKNKEMVFDKTYYDTVKNTSYEEIKYIVESHECKIIEYSLFLDKKWYTKKYNVPDAVLDYLTTGLSNFKNPNSHFDAKWYFENNKKLMDNITYPLVDYEIRGKYNNSFTENFLKQNPVIIEETQEYQIIVSNSVFDQKWYINKYLNGDIKQDPVKHYLTKGLEKYYNPNSQFNMIWYIANYMDKKQRYIVPLVYYICNEDPDTPTKPDNISNEEELQLLNKILILEDYDLLKNSKYFDSKFYMDNNIDIPLEMDPINHYLKYGWKENRIPSLYFDPEFYLRYNPDIKKANVNPLVHFINKKNKEKRPYHNAKMQLSVSDEITAEMISDYNIIQESDWFDQRWYESNNPIIESENLDPFLHYIVYGVLEGIDPHPLFSTSKYLEDNTDIAGLNLNPLVHYIKSGQFESRINYISDKFNTFYNEDNEYTPCEINNILSRITNKISIILPVYADFEGIKKCVQSILNNTSINYELIIVNDGSNLDIELFLDSLKNISNIKIVTNENNIGFIGSINKGIKLSSNDVVILHEDTIVTKGWLSKLVIAAYSDNNIGTVTPFSNSSDINIDALDNINDIDDTGYKLGKLSINNIESPVGSSFCMYIKKDVIDDIGLFDESINYHYSDVDFTSKALYNGWLNIRNDSIFVYHNGTISKLDSNDLKEDTKNLLLKSYPDLFDKWFLFKESKKLKDSLNNINNLQNIKKRVLYVTTSNKENKPLLDKIYHRLNEDYEIFILSIKKNKLSLMLHSLNKSGMIKQWTINNDIEDYINAYFNIITNLNIDNVFIKSLNEYTSPEYNNQVILFLLAFYLEIETVTINNLNVLINDNFNENISLKEVIKNKSNEINFSKNKLVIYTVITDNSDEISKPLYINDNFDYICFTNNPNLKSEFWQIKLIENIELLKYKTMPHKYLSKYDYSLWIDPNINIINNLEECLHKYLKNNKFLCIENIEDNNKIIQKQLKQYESEGYLVNNNCIASEFIFRKHDDKDIINTMNCWYDESIKEGYDPNLSLNYACWKTNIDIDILKIPKNRNQYFIKKYTHLKSLFDLKYTNKQVNDMISSLKNQVSIIVPIYNKYNETKKCIESIIKNTNPNNKLILINDCSTDKKINKLLGSYENNEFIQIIRNDKRLGYINCINKGIHLSLNDVVLLNQETIVTPRWLSKLILTAYSSSDIDVVVPFSNNSIFNLCKTNDSINNINKLVENISLDKY